MTMTFAFDSDSEGGDADAAADAVVEDDAETIFDLDELDEHVERLKREAAESQHAIEAGAKPGLPGTAKMPDGRGILEVLEFALSNPADKTRLSETADQLESEIELLSQRAKPEARVATPSDRETILYASIDTLHPLARALLFELLQQHKSEAALKNHVERVVSNAQLDRLMAMANTRNMLGRKVAELQAHPPVPPHEKEPVTAQDIAHLRETAKKLNNTALSMARRLMGVVALTDSSAAMSRLRAIDELLTQHPDDVLTLSTASEELANAHKDALMSVSMSLSREDARSPDDLLKVADKADADARKFQAEATLAQERAGIAQQKATDAARHALKVMQSLLGGTTVGVVPSVLRERNESMLQAEKEYKRLLESANEATKRASAAKNAQAEALKLRACAMLADESWGDAILRVCDTAKAMQRTYASLNQRHRELLDDTRARDAQRGLMIEEAAEQTFRGVCDALRDAEAQIVDAAIRQTETPQRLVDEGKARLRAELQSLDAQGLVGVSGVMQTLESVANDAAAESVDKTRQSIHLQRLPILAHLVKDIPVYGVGARVSGGSRGSDLSAGLFDDGEM